MALSRHVAVNKRPDLAELSRLRGRNVDTHDLFTWRRCACAFARPKRGRGRVGWPWQRVYDWPRAKHAARINATWKSRRWRTELLNSLTWMWADAVVVVVVFFRVNASQTKPNGIIPKGNFLCFLFTSCVCVSSTVFHRSHFGETDGVAFTLQIKTALKNMWMWKPSVILSTMRRKQTHNVLWWTLFWKYLE